MQIYNASFTAFYNVNRPRRKKALSPIKKQVKHFNSIDRNKAVDEFKIVEYMEKKNGKGWVEKIYKANGLKRGGK
ncbi:MAG: hypothetical protein ACLSU9_11045 [Anaerovoracaceae bacterium]